MRVLVYGGRTYDNRTRVFAELDAIHRETPVTLVVHGAATGADTLAGLWAKERGVRPDPYPAAWDDLQATVVRAVRRPDGSFYNAAAGNNRNLLMMTQGKPDIAVEFVGDRGTRDMRQIVTREMRRRPLRYVRVWEHRLVQVTAPHFCAGFETDGKYVIKVAPILRKLRGMTEDEARAFIKNKGWKASIVLAPLGNGRQEE